MSLSELRKVVATELVERCGSKEQPSFEACAHQARNSRASSILADRQREEKVKQFKDPSFKPSTKPVDVFSQ